MSCAFVNPIRSFCAARAALVSAKDFGTSGVPRLRSAYPMSRLTLDLLWGFGGICVAFALYFLLLAVRSVPPSGRTPKRVDRGGHILPVSPRSPQSFARFHRATRREQRRQRMEGWR